MKKETLTAEEMKKAVMIFRRDPIPLDDDLSYQGRLEKQKYNYKKASNDIMEVVLDREGWYSIEEKIPEINKPIIFTSTNHWGSFIYTGYLRSYHKDFHGDYGEFWVDYCENMFLHNARKWKMNWKYLEEEV